MEKPSITISPHDGSKGFTIRQPVADQHATASTVLNDGIDMSAIELQMSYDGDKVSIGCISRKRGVPLKAGCRGISPDEMDELCRAWLNMRGWSI